MDSAASESVAGASSRPSSGRPLPDCTKPGQNRSVTGFLAACHIIESCMSTIYSTQSSTKQKQRALLRCNEALESRSRPSASSKRLKSKPRRLLNRFQNLGVWVHISVGVRVSTDMVGVIAVFKGVSKIGDRLAAFMGSVVDTRSLNIKHD